MLHRTNYNNSMLLSLLENFVLGLAISAVPGAVFFETIRRSLLEYSSVFRFLLGNFSGMVLIAASSYLGLTRLLSGEIFSLIFYLVSGSVLVYLGTTAIMVKKSKIERIHNSISSKRSAYLVGLTLAVANPLSIIFWASLMGKFIKEDGGGMDAILNSIVVLAGAAILFIILVVCAKFAKNLLTPNRLIIMSRFFGVIITIYGLTTLMIVMKQLWF